MIEEERQVVIKKLAGYNSEKEFLYCTSPPPETNPYEYWPREQKFCGYQLKPVKNQFYNGELIREGLYCPRCQKLYRPTIPKKKDEENKGEKRVVSFILPNVVLDVGKGLIRCKRENHDVEDVTGILKNVNDVQVKINVKYCKNEDKYFISKDDFLEYQKKYKALLGNYVFSDLNESGNQKGFSSMEEESPLHAYGYNVSKANGLSEAERHCILANIMNFELMEKHEIISYLDVFIDFRQNQKNMMEACSKWRSDREWVRSYKFEEQRKVSIIRTRKYRR